MSNGFYKAAAVRAFYFAIDRSFALDRDRTLAGTLDRALARTGERHSALVLDRALALDRDLDRALVLALDLDLDLARDQDLALALDRARAYTGDELNQKLRQLRDELPDTSYGKRNQFKQWWQTNAQHWTKRLWRMMISDCNIGHDWQFTDEQKRQLTQYYEANKLLVDCLNSECYVSRSLREEIEATLLLPIDSLAADG